MKRTTKALARRGLYGSKDTAQMAADREGKRRGMPIKVKRVTAKVGKKNRRGYKVIIPSD